MTDKNDLTARENEVLALAWQCFDNEPKVDMNKLASLTGYTPGSAAFTMGKIKRKLRAKTQGISEDNPTPKKSQGRPRTTNAHLGTPKSTRKRSSTADATPSKRQKKGGRKAEQDSDEEGEEEPGRAVKKEEFVDEPDEPTYGFHDQLRRAANYHSVYGQAYVEDDDEDHM